MNKYLMLVLSFFISVQVVAKETMAIDEMVQKCSGFADVAKSAVSARQKRIPASYMYKTIINQKKDIQTMLKFALDQAYKTPLAKTEEEKESIILEFTNKAFSECMDYFTEENEK